MEGTIVDVLNNSNNRIEKLQRFRLMPIFECRNKIDYLCLVVLVYVFYNGCGPAVRSILLPWYMHLTLGGVILLALSTFAAIVMVILVTIFLSLYLKAPKQYPSISTSENQIVSISYDRFQFNVAEVKFEESTSSYDITRAIPEHRLLFLIAIDANKIR